MKYHVQISTSATQQRHRLPLVTLRAPKPWECDKLRPRFVNFQIPNEPLSNGFNHVKTEAVLDLAESLSNSFIYLILLSWSRLKNRQEFIFLKVLSLTLTDIIINCNVIMYTVQLAWAMSRKKSVSWKFETKNFFVGVSIRLYVLCDAKVFQ